MGDSFKESRILSRKRSWFIRQFEAFPAGKEAKDLLTAVLKKIDNRQKININQIREEWSRIIGEKYAPMTQVMECHEGLLTIKIDSAPLFSVLQGTEKVRLENELKKRLPSLNLKKLNFRR